MIHFGKVGAAVALMLAAVLFAACAGERGAPDPATGSITARLVWPADGQAAALVAPGGHHPPEGIAWAVPAGVVTLTATVSAGDIATPLSTTLAVAAGETGTGVIEAVPEGTGRLLVVSGADAGGATLFRGEAANLSITANAATDAGAVQMFVAIADPNLQACLDDGPGAGGYSVVTDLQCQIRGITGLTGIEALTGLTTLNFSGNNIADLTPLSGLTALTQLVVNGNPRISSLAPIAGLTTLQELDVGSTGVTNFSPLQNSTGLTTLTANNLSGIDLATIATLTGLTTLEVSASNLSSLNALAPLTGLQVLSAHDQPIVNVSALSTLVALKTLDLSSTNLADVTPLSLLTNLETLQLVGIPTGPTGAASLVTLVKATLINFQGGTGWSCADFDTLEAALGTSVVVRGNCT